MEVLLHWGQLCARAGSHLHPSRVPDPWVRAGQIGIQGQAARHACQEARLAGPAPCKAAQHRPAQWATDSDDVGWCRLIGIVDELHSKPTIPTSSAVNLFSSNARQQ